MPKQGLANTTPGKLIAVEGLDGSGKSTQVYLLKRWLELSGYKVFFTEWNSSELVRSATRRGKKQNLLTPTTFSLIHCTDFADRYERNILPMLKAGSSSWQTGTSSPPWPGTPSGGARRSGSTSSTASPTIRTSPSTSRCR